MAACAHILHGSKTAGHTSKAVEVEQYGATCLQVVRVSCGLMEREVSKVIMTNGGTSAMKGAPMKRDKVKEMISDTGSVIKNSCLWYLHWSCWIIGKTNIFDKFSKFQCTFVLKINVSTQERHLKVTATAYILMPLCYESKENMHFVSYLIKYLIEEIGTLCKLRPQGMLGPVYPEISSEGLRTDKEGQHGQHTLRRKTLFISMQF